MRLPRQSGNVTLRTPAISTMSTSAYAFGFAFCIDLACHLVDSLSIFIVGPCFLTLSFPLLPLLCRDLFFFRKDDVNCVSVFAVRLPQSVGAQRHSAVKARRVGMNCSYKVAEYRPVCGQKQQTQRAPASVPRPVRSGPVGYADLAMRDLRWCRMTAWRSESRSKLARDKTKRVLLILRGWCQKERVGCKGG